MGIGFIHGVLTMQECSRVFPNGKVYKGFVNEDNTYCIIKIAGEIYKYPITNPKLEEEK